MTAAARAAVQPATGRLDRLGLAAAGTTALAWGLVGTLVREIPTLSPREIVAGRLAFALVASLPLVAAARVRGELATALRAPAAWALAAMLTGYYVVAVIAFRIAPVAEVALLIATAPLCALGMRRIAGERAAPHERQGAALAVVGVAVTLVPALRAGMQGGAGAATGAHALGDGLALVSAVLSAGYALTFQGTQRRAAARGRGAPGALGVAVLTFVVGCAGLAAHAVATGVPFVAAAALDRRGWALLALFGVACTFVPTVGFATASQRLSPVLASASLLLVPVVSAIAAAVALGEVPSGWLVPGGGLVLVGIVRLLGIGTARAGAPA
ncbi:MAG TPA: EamA family transporter [Gemmatirosa sp.]